MEDISQAIRPIPSKLHFAVWCVLLGIYFLGFYFMVCHELPFDCSILIMVLTPVLFNWAVVQTKTKSYPTGFKGILLAALILVGVAAFAYLMAIGKLNEALSSLAGRFIFLLTWLAMILGRWQMLYGRV